MFAVKHLAKTAKPRHLKRKRSPSTSSSSSSLDDEPLKRRKTDPTLNLDTEQETQLLMNQGKQPALIVYEKHSNKNPNSSSTGVIPKPIDEDNNQEKYGPKIPDPLSQRVEGK